MADDLVDGRTRSGLPGAKATARYVRVSPTKARRVVDLVRGRSAQEALDILTFAPQAASADVYKVVRSAMANAENNHNLDPSTLRIGEAYVNEGPTLKRFRRVGRGRAHGILKRTSHVTIEVESQPVDARTRRSGRVPASGRGRTR